MKAFKLTGLIVMLVLLVVSLSLSCTPAVVCTEDMAMGAVLERLNNVAQSPEAKRYLADFLECIELDVYPTQYGPPNAYDVFSAGMRESGCVPIGYHYWTDAIWVYMCDDASILVGPDALRVEADLQQLSNSEDY